MPSGASTANMTPDADQGMRIAKLSEEAAGTAAPFQTSILVRLALTNSIGYAGSTTVPFWVGEIGPRLGMPLWFGGAAATGQLLAAAIFNLLTPILFARVSPLRLARTALPIACALFILTLLAHPIAFVIGCIGGGTCLGIVLNATNRIVAASSDIQKGYSVFLISECLFAASMLFGASLLLQHLGLISVFLTLPAVTLVGTLLVYSVPTAQVEPAPIAARLDRGRPALRSMMALAGLFIFFWGQSCINASSLALAHAAGIQTAAAGRIISMAVVLGMFGAAASRLLGERIGVRLPILGATSALILSVLLCTRIHTFSAFAILILSVQLVTGFIVPYFFTLLATLDGTGRLASIGPALLLGGAAIGPSLSAAVLSSSATSLLGPVTATALLVSAALIAGSREPAKSRR